MSEYIIITDSTADMPPEMADDLGLVIIPYSFRIDNKDYLNYLDNREFDPHEFYMSLKAGKSSSTSLVSAAKYMEVFEPFLREGKDVIYLCLSTGLSSSYSQSLIAAEELLEKYPGRKAIMIDSLSASFGQGMLAYYAAKEKQKGTNIDELAVYIRGLIPHLCHWFTVDDLNHLRRGGRVSGAAAFVGTVLGIKPMLHVDAKGMLVPVEKVRGRQKSLEFLADKMKKTMIKPENPQDLAVFIGHGDALDDANKLKAMIESRTGCKNIQICYIGPVVGSHTGPGTITMFFLGEQR